MEMPSTYTAFEGDKLVFKGSLPEVVLKIKKRIGDAENSPILIFSDTTGNQMDFNFQGSEKDVVKRLEIYVGDESPVAAGPGRPKLGVVAREVLLLPRQWEWLASQSGGASALLRRLVDEAAKKATGGDAVKQSQERTYKFMHALAGDWQGYEEALRALYKKHEKQFQAEVAVWPKDVKAYVLELAAPVFVDPG
jgi:uncharacterized protein